MVGRWLGRGAIAVFLVACAGRSTTTSRQGDGGTASGGGTGGSGTGAAGGTVPGTGGSGGTGGSAGRAGAASEGGDGSSGEDPTTIDDACRYLCVRLNPTCRDSSFYVRCHDDCVMGNTGVPDECTGKQVDYLVCIGNTELSCGSVSETPAACLNAEWELVRCLLGESLAPGCESRMTTQGLSSCTIVTTCGGIERSVICDGEDDGTGTSLCDCYRDGELTGSAAPQALGILACADTMNLCAEL
jgi:hypothetical protein